MSSALSQKERDECLERLPRWVFDRERNALHRSLALADFSEAFGLMTRVAIEAEKIGHHPEWSNAYNRIEIWLTTHDAGNAVSAMDVALAAKIDALLCHTSIAD